jgi:hypothetical protein
VQVVLAARADGSEAVGVVVAHVDRLPDAKRERERSGKTGSWRM